MSKLLKALFSPSEKREKYGTIDHLTATESGVRERGLEAGGTSGVAGQFEFQVRRSV